MAFPLATIPHVTRSVTAALHNNCWNVYVSNDGHPLQISRARTYRGQFQVYSRRYSMWLAVKPTDTLYQS